MIESAIASYLLAQPGLTALIGTRIYPVLLPQAPTLPAVTYQRISGVEDYSTTGRLVQTRLQFSCWSGNYGQAKQAAGQIKAALRNLTGLAGGIYVAGAWIEGEVDFYEPATQTEAGIYQVAVDVRLDHE